MAVGQNQWYHYGVGAPPILVYFSGDWDVHWGYGILTHGHMISMHLDLTWENRREQSKIVRPCRDVPKRDDVKGSPKDIQHGEALDRHTRKGYPRAEQSCRPERLSVARHPWALCSDMFGTAHARTREESSVCSNFVAMSKLIVD